MFSLAVKTKPPRRPKIYHIVHVDRLCSIVKEGHLWCDAKISSTQQEGTCIGIDSIKKRRLTQLTLSTYPDLHIGECVPFYFCPRSVMLFFIFKMQGDQTSILHLEADLRKATKWAQLQKRRWAFTLSNAGAYRFEDRDKLTQLREIDWAAVQSTMWCGRQKKGKQAEFLMENRFPWKLVERIGVSTEETYEVVKKALAASHHQPKVDIKSDWYYFCS